ncbi:MAG TPA: DUF938 domain-containing protein [Alphaproteobacteria bacterium]|nr:DUF938 domain-containing protein [Alphaproteobacteria bacterium]
MTDPREPNPARLHAPATLRNRAPILEALRGILPASGTVLELASGTGEHAAHFAAALPHLTWQPSDPDPVNRASIAAWAEVPNQRPPLDIDATQGDWPDSPVAAIYCANMIHIAPWAACLGLLAGAGRGLVPGGPLILYGPFRVAGRMVESNVAFDRSLRGRDPAWGVRDLERVAEAARPHGLALERTFEMPANNLIVVLRRVVS